MLPKGLETFDTGRVAPEARIGYWRDTVARMTSPADFDGRPDENPRGTLTCGAFERFTINHAFTSAIHTFRGKQHTRAARGLSYLYLQLDGEGELTSIGHSFSTRPGSLVLFDETTPYRFRALSPVRTMSIGFPSSLLAARLPDYRGIAMRPLDGDAGLNQVLQSAMRSMGMLFIDQSVRRFPRALFMSLIEMMAATIDDRDDCGDNASTLARWGGKIRAHVEANLDDPELTPASIAREFGISSRYLRLIFASDGDKPDDGETLRRFILRRRLEECALRLADSSTRSISITHLAHGWGFSDSSYFSRRFIEHFGATPRDFRAAALARGAQEGAAGTID